MDTGRIAAWVLKLSGGRYWQKWDKGGIAHQVDDYWLTNEGEQQFR